MAKIYNVRLEISKAETSINNITASLLKTQQKQASYCKQGCQQSAKSLRTLVSSLCEMRLFYQKKIKSLTHLIQILEREEERQLVMSSDEDENEQNKPPTAFKSVEPTESVVDVKDNNLSLFDIDIDNITVNENKDLSSTDENFGFSETLMDSLEKYAPYSRQRLMSFFSESDN